MKKRIANADQHLAESEEAAKKNTKNRLSKRLNQRKSKVNSNNNDDDNNVSHVIKIPSTTIEEEEEEYTTIANSILNDGDQDDADTDAIVTMNADGTQIRQVL